ncbi:MAG: DarT ssDNA thymidine ADP-ribosyltransferase family protein [Cyanobacteria bacterium J06648_11]
MTVPAQPKIYHIVHVDRLPSIIADEHLWCDSTVMEQDPYD